MQATFGIMSSRQTFSEGYYRSITLDQPASDLTNFPVLITGTYTYLKTVGSGGKVVNYSGYDIIFYSDEALTTILDFERVYWNGTTGEVEFWVRIPTLTSATATVIYMAYGNTSITTDQQDAVNTWDSSYKGVWHFPNGTTLTADDSTSTGADGTLINTPTAISGKIDGGVNLASASSEYITMGNVLDFTTNDFTIELWYRSSSGVSGYFVSKGGGGSSGAYVIYFNSSGRVAFYLQTDGSNWKQMTTNGAVNTANGAWHHFMAVRSGASNPTINIYRDGALDNFAPQGAGTVGTVSNSDNLTFSSLTSLYNGDLDEIKISNVVRSATYNATAYSNQNDPANFYVIGSETPV